MKLVFTAQKMEFSMKDFFSKCDQIRSFLKACNFTKSSTLRCVFFALFCKLYKCYQIAQNITIKSLKNDCDWTHFQYSCKRLACSFTGEWAPSEVFSRSFAQILKESFSRSGLGSCFQSLIFLNVKFYNFRSSHLVDGILFYGNDTNICSVTDCSKLGSRYLKKAVVDFIFCIAASLQSLALLKNELLCGQFSANSTFGTNDVSGLTHFSPVPHFYTP